MLGAKEVNGVKFQTETLPDFHLILPTKQGIKNSSSESRGNSCFGVHTTTTGITGLINCSVLWIACASPLFSKKLSTGLSWTVSIWTCDSVRIAACLPHGGRTRM